MPDPSRRPVLVTGSNRSGTTWVGRMLCLSNELAYLHEPFNPGIWPRWMATPVPYRNLYVCAENEAAYVDDMGAVIARRFPWRRQVREVRSIRDGARLARDTVARSARRASSRPTLVKDPIAVFSAEWLAKRFSMDVVMMVRSPVAFAGSLKRLGWAFDFGQWAGQELLMRDHLRHLAPEIRRAAEEPPGIIEQAILSWNATYGYVDRMRAAHPDWHVVHYEELAADPKAGFTSLYARLGLRFDDRVSDRIARFTDEQNAREVSPRDKGGIRRHSAAALTTWQVRLTPDEVDLVEERTRGVAERLGVAVRGGR